MGIGFRSEVDIVEVRGILVAKKCATVSVPAGIRQITHSIDEDEVRNILVTVIEKLQADDYRRLKTYLEQDSKRGGFPAWLAVVTRRIAIDYMRAHPDFIDRRKELEASAAGAWILPGELPSNSQLGGHRPPVTNRGSALTLLRFAYESLPEDQMKALEMWILNTDYKEMASTLGLESGKDANKVVRAALERLRRKFRGTDS